MDDEIREEIHSKCANCSNAEFLIEYWKRDTGVFREIVRHEFRDVYEILKEID